MKHVIGPDNDKKSLKYIVHWINFNYIKLKYKIGHLRV